MLDSGICSIDSNGYLYPNKGNQLIKRFCHRCLEWRWKVEVKVDVADKALSLLLLLTNLEQSA